MKEAFRIRRANRQDAGEIGRIHVEAARAAYVGIYSDEYLGGLHAEDRAARWVEEGRGHLATGNADFAVFVAFEGERMIGFSDVGPAGGAESSNVAKLYAIYLDPAYIGKGVGRALFMACARHAEARGFEALVAEVLSRNSPARRFYERMGGQALPETERLIETGGTKEKIITWRWATLPR